MPRLLLPSTRELFRQRSARWGIDASHPLARGLISALPYWSPDAPGFMADLVTGSRGLESTADKHSFNATRAGGFANLGSGYHEVSNTRFGALSAGWQTWGLALSMVDYTTSMYLDHSVFTGGTGNNWTLRYDGFNDYLQARLQYSWSGISVERPSNADAFNGVRIVLTRARNNGGNAEVSISADGEAWRDATPAAQTDWTPDQMRPMGYGPESDVLLWMMAWNRELTTADIQLLQNWHTVEDLLSEPIIWNIPLEGGVDVSVTPAAATAACVKVDPTVVLGSLVIAPSVTSAACAKVDPTVVVGATAAKLKDGYFPDRYFSVWWPVDYFQEEFAGGATVAPAPATAACGKVDPTVVLGSTSVTPAVSTAACAKVDPTVVLGSLTLAPTVLSAACSKVDPTVVLGSVSVTPGVTFARGAVVAPTVVLGSVSVTPAATYAVATVVAPTVVLGSISLTPTVTFARTAGVDPTVLAGGDLSVTPAAITAACAKVDPTVLLGSTSVTPAVLSAACAKVDPTVILGSLTITPAVLSAACAKVDPTVILGSLTITPATTYAVASVVAPTVLLGSTSVTPAVLFARGAVVAPSVVLGSVVVAPAVTYATTATLGPTVLLGSVLITPAFAWAVAATYFHVFFYPTGTKELILEDRLLALGISPRVMELPDRLFELGLEGRSATLDLADRDMLELLDGR